MVPASQKSDDDGDCTLSTIGPKDSTAPVHTSRHCQSPRQEYPSL